MVPIHHVGAVAASFHWQVHYLWQNMLGLVATVNSSLVKCMSCDRNMPLEVMNECAICGDQYCGLIGCSTRCSCDYFSDQIIKAMTEDGQGHQIVSVPRGQS